MALTLTQYRTRVLQLLDDISSLRFTSDQVDQGLRNALGLFDKFRPLVRTYQLDCTGYQVIALPADFSALMISRVQLQNTISTTRPMDLTFKAERVNEQWEIETVAGTYAAGQVLTVTYVSRHTIDGLDLAAGTTIEDDALMSLGGAACCAYSRAVSRTESINMQPGVQSQLLESARLYMDQYLGGLRLSTSVVMAAFD